MHHLKIPPNNVPGLPESAAAGRVVTHITTRCICCLLCFETEGRQLRGRMVVSAAVLQGIYLSHSNSSCSSCSSHAVGRVCECVEGLRMQQDGVLCGVECVYGAFSVGAASE